MHTNDVVLQVAAAAGITEKQAREALHAVKQCVVKSLQSNSAVILTGFGTFSLKHRATGKQPHFKPGNSLRAAVQPQPAA